ncbi:hypothetical protein BDY21DRAFT_402168 [Lineolata rhizophorae]|uniref:Uncharacterized protein n=1 Tax=Lineolata rhizophorae TaxID=578093 RepID=A0A6A6NQA9_9PEZI|nr:hypothetical protein BDY21DRAFT_402168 [Lineolata rhizophorae]
MASGRLLSKVAVVTGSSSGMGRAIALLFHREGASVVCADLKPTISTANAEESTEALVDTHEQIANESGNSIFVETDVRREQDMKSLIEKATQKFGRVDIMVNNAGVLAESKKVQKIWEYDESAWDHSFAVNSRGVFLGCKYAAAQMIGQDPLPSGDRGWIVNLASIAGTIAVPGFVGYTASKQSVIGITKNAAIDLTEHRVHVNAVAPGFVDTPMIVPLLKDSLDAKKELNSLHPFRGLGKAEDIAHAVLFLASKDNSWMTGSILTVDGGYTVK